MRMRKLLLIGLLLLGSIGAVGCLRFKPAEPPSSAGVFKSYDYGETWQAKNRFVHSGGVSSIGAVGIEHLQFDPQDAQTLYIGTSEDGVLFSYDSAESWQQARGLKGGKAQSLAIDPSNKCILYATRANTLVKSVDCGRNWTEMYLDTVATKLLTQIAVDPVRSTTIYIGNTAGDILKSEDAGVNWRVVNRLNNQIEKILFDADESSTLYVATSKKGIFKTADGGESWVDLNTGLKPYSASLDYKQLILVPDTEHGLLLAAKYGLLYSNDGGATWNPISLITPVATADIFTVAVNPQNSNEIYYATGSTFYKSVDGGVNWITRRLPSRAIPSLLLVDPQNPNVVYLGLSAPQK